MIQANELRIGNWVYSPVSVPYCPAGITRVSSIQYDGINYSQDMGASGIMPFEKLVGIPMIPEILEKAGFVFGKYKYQDQSFKEAYISQNIKFIISKGYKDAWGLEYFPYPQSHNVIPGEIEYVHQLQNLYFTGTELQINLEATSETATRTT